MIETRIYKCEYCGAEFDDEHEAHCHEYTCQYKDVKRRKGSCLGFYREDGSEIKFDNVAFRWSDFNDVEAFTIGNYMDVKFVKGLFDYCCYGNPFHAIENEKNPSYYGLWWFDPERHPGDWVHVDDQIEKWTNIKNKFEKGA